MNSNYLTAIPLCVDLDNALLRSDLLIESALVLIKRNPLYALRILWWWIRGKAYLQTQIAQRTELDAAGLAWHQALVEYLRQEYDAGRKLVLCSTHPSRDVEAIAHYFGIFDHVLQYDMTPKLAVLRTQFGAQGFDYTGHSTKDAEVWRQARHAVVVDSPPEAQTPPEVERTFLPERPVLNTYLHAMRVHQWLKNLLLFVPLILSHQILDWSLLLHAGIGFISFGLCASSVYILNDLLDLADDRRHPSKRQRPFAAGRIPLAHGVLMLPVLLGGALFAAYWLPWIFLGSLGLYYVTTLAYSWYLKRLVLLDVLVLAGLYTVRLIAGAAAVAVTLSFWLLGFAMFLFFSLALVKRYSELLLMAQQGNQTASGRGYTTDDMEILLHFGTASGLLSVLVLALYVNSEQVTTLYTHPHLIWLLCPLLLYWITRVWLLTRRGQMHEDPVLFAATDRHSHWLVVIGTIILGLAI